MKNGFHYRPAIGSILLSLACTSGLFSLAPSLVTAAETSPVSINITAQPLASAITNLSRQTGIQIFSDGKLLADKTAPAINGHMSVQQALDKLLTGTGLNALNNGKGYIIKKEEAVPQSSLPEVSVSSSSIQLGNEGLATQGYHTQHASVAGFNHQALIDTPYSVKVIPQALIQNHFIENLGNLERYDASVANSGYNPGWYSAPEIRGLSLHNTSNYRYNGLMLVNQQVTGLENKERVEILKGLSALQAGFGSPGGLINYVTKRPTPASVNLVNFSINQYGNTKVHSDLSRRNESGTFGIRLNAAVERQKSYIRAPGSDRHFVSLATDWLLTDATTFQLDFEHEKRDEINQPNFPVTTTGQLPSHINPRRFLGQNWASYPTEMNILSGKLEHTLNDNWSVLAEFNWGRQKRDQSAMNLETLQPNGDVSFNFFESPNQQQDFLNTRLSLNGTFNTGPFRHNIAVGLSSHRFKYRYDEYFWGPLSVTSTNLYRPVRFSNPHLATGINYLVYRKDERGVFLNDVVSLHDQWELHLGGRYTQRDTREYNPDGSPGNHYDKNEFTPNVALLFKPRQDVTVYGSYMEGLEDGGTARTGTTNQFKQLAPLKSKQWETGVKTQINPYLLAEFAIFRIERPAEFINDSNTFVQSGGRVHKGIEVGLTGKLSPEWTLFSSGMLLDAKFEETGDAATKGQRPTATPNHRVVITSEYAPTALSGWTFVGNWSHTGAMQTSDSNTTESTDAYDLFAIGARYNHVFGNTPTTMRLYVDNLFDKRYWSNVSYGFLTPGAPRTAMASISFQF
ncbi:TonB-dependent receptor [Methylobacillus gramineus]|uniref:TonB-dependent siderophore receptor n=1 Tax=Methylobacillus gramineus TaxID=755169 RepID=UPI001CFFB8FD|nr:TonB-dependent receptor [Methylobacillus gramineus]MCB5184865.1 TonB-dependent receptor [Methylobacillus gramineus]